jgi:S1-C subfamily serine protease
MAGAWRAFRQIGIASGRASDQHRAMAIRFRHLLAVCVVAALSVVASAARAMPPETLASVVSVLPAWPGQVQGGFGAGPGMAPEGSGVVIAPGIVATAWHVVEPAERIDIRLSDGRILPAALIAGDAATDIAMLRVDADLAALTLAPDPGLADPACAVGNAFGLGLSVTCGVVSALGVSNAGFNPVEDFIQTDAAVNPGVSGGALVDSQGRLLGMVSAIFASEADNNIGVNFAVSAALLKRVSDALLTDGAVRFPQPGWTLSTAERETLARIAAPVVARLDRDGPAALAGMRTGDLVIAVDGRRVRTPRDVTAALAHVPQGAPDYAVTLERSGARQTLRIAFAPDAPAPQPESLGDCPHPAPVCLMRQAVFPVSSFDPVGSATRIGPGLLVTNRHVVGDRTDAVVHTPDGPRGARVVASAYTGDLVLLEVPGLPADGHIPLLDAERRVTGDFYVVGADITREEIRVFDPGGLIAPPADGAALGRLHVEARMQPGVSGGALVDGAGALVGIAVGGGDGRFEALPVAAIVDLLALRAEPEAQAVTDRLGAAFAACADALDTGEAQALADPCLAADNHGQLLEAGRVLARAGDFDGAAALHGAAVAQVPNSLNARISLLVSLQLGARFADMIPHARRVMQLAPDDPQVLRFAIQSGVWGGDPALAEAGYAALVQADPVQAQAARRFIDNAPPAPVRP